MHEEHAGPDGAAVRRAVVTGGDGFLGRHLVDLLVDRDVDVLVIDDGRSGRAPRPGRRPERQLRADFRDPAALQALRDHAPDTAFHLAAMHFVPDCDRDPASCLTLNVLGTERLLSALRGTDVERVLFCSSAVVYGFADRPRRESDPLEPRHVYAHSKLLGEGLVQALHADRPDVRAVSARLFNLVGPGDTAPHVVPEIVRAVAAGRELRLGNVWPRRDYVHVADVAAALVALAHGPPASLQVNVGTGQGHSVADVVGVAAAVLGREPRVVAEAARERATDGHLVADVGLLRSSTSWRPTRTLEDTVRQLVQDVQAS